MQQSTERRTLLLVLGFLTFASVYANVVIIPVLVQIASDFGMASVIGLPVAGIVAEASSWRVSVAMVGVLALVASFLLVRLLVRDRPEPDDRRARALFWQVLTNRSAVAALASSLMGALFWFTWVTFMVLYFQRTYALSLGTASTVALTMGIGVLVGSQVGGRLGDRVGHKQIAAWTMLGGGVLLYVLTNAHLALLAAAALNLVLSGVIGGRFTANQALLSEQMPEARGTMLSISSSIVSVGMVAGAAIGGILVDRYGFAALGLFCACVGVLSAVIVLAFVREARMELEVA